MSEDKENFLSRWSRRKLAPKSTEQTETTRSPLGESGDKGMAPSDAQHAATAHQRPISSEQSQAPVVPLPALDALTPQADFTPFMQTHVEPAVRRAALKTLFKDPHFNVMDGLDIYIDDYSQPDPIPAAMMQTLYQAQQHVFKTPAPGAASDQPTDEEVDTSQAAEPTPTPTRSTDAFSEDETHIQLQHQHQHQTSSSMSVHRTPTQCTSTPLSVTQPIKKIDEPR